MRDTLTRHETSSGERLRMGILGILGFMGTPGIAGLRVEGVRGQSHGIGSPPSHVERVLTHFTHIRVLPNRTDRLLFMVSRQCRWGNAAAIDGLDGPNRQDGQTAEEKARC